MPLRPNLTSLAKVVRIIWSLAPVAVSPIISDSKKTRWFSNSLRSDYELTKEFMRNQTIHPIAVTDHGKMFEIFPIND